ncbi:hypothetical protein [Cohnella cellulosilytica]
MSGYKDKAKAQHIPLKKLPPVSVAQKFPVVQGNEKASVAGPLTPPD